MFQIAEEVWAPLLPHIEGRPAGSMLAFAGHSLGCAAWGFAMKGLLFRV